MITQFETFIKLEPTQCLAGSFFVNTSFNSDSVIMHCLISLQFFFLSGLRSASVAPRSAWMGETKRVHRMPVLGVKSILRFGYGTYTVKPTAHNSKTGMIIFGAKIQPVYLQFGV
jgi:hypothetical protein